MRKQEKLALEREKKIKKIRANEKLISSLRSLSSRVAVILVEPKYQGNIGAVARSMANAGLNDLVIVNGPAPDHEAYIRAIYGKYILDSYRSVESLSEISDRFDALVATSSSTSLNERRFRRIPILPESFWKDTITSGERIGLVFGREDDGLRNDEVDLCNYFITIPSNPLFPAYNLSHSVAIILYEMVKYVAQNPEAEYERISKISLPLLLEEIENLLTTIEYPKHSLNNTLVMIRRIIARSRLSDAEYHKLRGIISRIERRLNFEKR